MRKITIHREKCVGCLTCTAACMVANFDVDSRSRIILDAKGKYNPIFANNAKDQNVFLHVKQEQCIRMKKQV